MAKIDPAFQAAPVLQTNNLEGFVEQQKQNQFARQQAQYEQGEKDKASVLKNLNVQLKGWEDKSGFDELQARNNEAYDIAMKGMKMGMNLNNPKNDNEVRLYKYLNDYHQQTAQLADQWNQQKQAYDGIMQAIAKDKESGENRINVDATMANLQKALKENTIEKRGGLLQNAIVQNPQIADVFKYIKDIKGNAPQLDTYTRPERDEAGNLHNVTVEKQDEKKQQDIYKYYRDKYKYADPNTKAYVHQQGEVNKGNEPEGWDDADRFVAMAYPNYKQKFIDKEEAKGNGGNGVNYRNFSIGNTSIKVSPGEHNTHDSPIGGKSFNDRYDFNTKGSFQVSTANGDKWESKPEKGETGWEPINNNGKLKSLLLFYDVPNKQLVFKADENEDMSWIRKNSIFSVPVENVPEAMKLPIVKDDGTTGTLKDIVGEQGGSGKKKNFNSKTGKFE